MSVSLIPQLILANGTAAAQSPAAVIGGFLPLILVFAVFFFLVIRPQMKRQKEMQKMIASVKVNDEVCVGGNIVGKVAAVKEQYFTVVVAHFDKANEQVKIIVPRNAISAVYPPNTIKDII